MKLNSLIKIEIFLLLGVVSSLFAAGWPVKDNYGVNIGTISDVYSSGRDMYPLFARDGIIDEFHEGVDIAASSGTSVHVIAGGTVDRVESEGITIKVGDIYHTYWHVTSTFTIGTLVQTNTKIGKISGNGW